MPRFVFERVQRRVASMARRTVAPSRTRAGAGQRTANSGRAGKEVLVARVGEVPSRRDVPGLGALTSSRQASCARRVATSAASTALATPAAEGTTFRVRTGSAGS